MFEIKIEGLEALQRKLSDIEKKQIPFALSKAINQTAYESRVAIQGEMKGTFDRPTPWVLNSVKYTKATKKRLYSAIGFVDPYDYTKTKAGVPKVGHLVLPHVEGGSRGAMGVEFRLRQIGILGKGEFIVPGKDMKRNKFGNMTRGMWMKMMSGLSANRDAINNSRGAKAAQWFILKKSDGRRYIMYRKTRRILLVAFVIVKKVHYKKRLDIHRVVQKVVDRRFMKNFEKAFAYAMATAR